MATTEGSTEQIQDGDVVEDVEMAGDEDDEIAGGGFGDIEPEVVSKTTFLE